MTTNDDEAWQQDSVSGAGSSGEPVAVTHPLNSPVELGVRIVMILVEAYPEHLDVNRLVLLDHAVLHSADLGGPESLHPALPVRAGELGVKRDVVEGGLTLLLRGGLAVMAATADGVQFQAGEGALHFVDILGSSYATALHDRVVWVVQNFDDLSEEKVRQHMRDIFGSWSEEFDFSTATPENGGWFK
ncbi:ABC-three component system middle component 2 [Rhodococcoides fascians]|uniref:ABC-three component system middle component 2 n=1 Tax=Rhodococcoides fascians TaxID=1828 RepID=UPI0012D34FA2|nr:ABC-three component system middle component 2 [Rhodococcus fascians]